MPNLISFVLGIASSIVATIIIYLFRFNFGFIVNLFFFKIYPDISGDYNCYSYDVTAISKSEAKNCNPKDSLIKKSGDQKPANQELLKWLKSKKGKVHAIMRIKQFANMIKGEVFLIEGNKVKDFEKINGKITPNRVLVLNSEIKDEKHHNFGTYLLNLTNDLSIIKGTRSGLCMECGDATSDYVVLEKK